MVEKSQSVTRLKELLFDSESRRLEDVQRQVEVLGRRESENHAVLVGRHDALADKTEAAFERAGSDERLLKSVAGILDGALREAEVKRHEHLSRAIAPLIVKTIKFELKNSQNEMVDALYPITGKLVKQYVRAAMNDLMADINRRLGGGRLSELETRAKAQGVSVAELVFAETQALKVDELFLVRRGSGELVAHWERQEDGEEAGASPQGSNRDVLIAGYLSGITAFSEEAFDDKKGSLRSLDLDGERIFVRASPAYLLAARVSGSAPAAVEQIIDDEFVQVLQAYKDALSKPAGANGASVPPAAEVNALLPTLAASFERRFAEKRDEIELKAAKTLASKPRLSPLQVAAALILVPLVAWGAWTGYVGYMTSRTQQAATAVVGSIEPLMGYPVRVDVAQGGRALAVSGLAPSEEAKALLAQRLQSEVPWAAVANNLTVLPAAQDLTPDVERLQRSLADVDGALLLNPMRRSLQRTAARLDAVTVGLASYRERSGSDARARAEKVALEIATSRSGISQIEASLAAGKFRLEGPQLLATVRRHLDAAESELASLASTPKFVAAASGSSGDPVSLAEDLSLSAERIGNLVVLADQAAQMTPIARDLMALRQQVSGHTSQADFNREIAAIKQRIDGIRLPVTPRDELQAYIRANAVFFENATDLNNAAAADRVVQRIAELLGKTDVKLRIVGYTDERTGPTVNNSVLSLSRAERVAALLVERGVSRERLVTVGRAAGPDIARVTGAGTPNRRVEFEIVFDGEPTAR